jgi:hypothetical protein
VKGASVVIGFLVLEYQCLNWLKFGYWQAMTLQDGIYWLFGFFSQTGWLGIDKIIQWYVDSVFERQQRLRIYGVSSNVAVL